MTEDAKNKWRPVLIWAVVVMVTAIVSAITGRTFAPAPPPVVVEVQKPAEPGEYTPTTGWVADPAAIAANLDPARTLQFAATPAGRAALGDDDVFLWQAARKVNNRVPPWYPNVNQRDVGCCVGCGWKHCVDVVQAVQITTGAVAEWKPVSVEAIYALSRVEIGRGQISGDGSVGAWAADAVRTYGVVPMAKYDDVDLTTFSPARAREMGRTGLPAALESVAKEHPVKTTALVRSWVDVKRAVQQGYPVAACSNQGFRMERDATGRARPQGTWGHCMAIIGIRSGANEGGFILNSWGDAAHTGPVWPADAPVAGFWADAEVIDRMMKMNDSFALSGLVGFPARRLDWTARAEPARGSRYNSVPAQRLALTSRPEVNLSW